MSVISDPIADLLIRLKNATLVHHESCLIPSSKLNGQILEILKKESYILDYESVKDSWPPMWTVGLHYNKKMSVIQGVKRISKPGARIYVIASKMPVVRTGIGTAIVSTSSGLMTAKEARKANVGGEVIAHIW